VRTFELLKKEAMTNTPTSRQADNIAAFAAKWSEGDLGCIEWHNMNGI